MEERGVWGGREREGRLWVGVLWGVEEGVWWEKEWRVEREGVEEVDMRLEGVEEVEEREEREGVELVEKRLEEEVGVEEEEGVEEVEKRLEEEVGVELTDKRLVEEGGTERRFLLEEGVEGGEGVDKEGSSQKRAVRRLVERWGRG